MTRVLLDTHLLLWSQQEPERLPAEFLELIVSPDIEPTFSTASIWEIAIKHSQRRADFSVHPGLLRGRLLESGFAELPILGQHAVAIAALPWVHRDPFDRLLVAQAIVEGIVLLTADATLARYPGPIRVF